LDKISIRRLEAADCPVISACFTQQNWDKPVALYEKYFREQLEGRRLVLTAFCEGQFAGYLCIKWMPKYPTFKEREIPEIRDLNVLLKYRNMGIATRLLDDAESCIAQRSSYAGIGVGLSRDYGAAQQIYIRRGYVPDGQGVYQKGRYLEQGDSATVDDDLVLYFLKKLN
jgi:GNAT superfamily N-acetyltransferase